MAIRCQQKSAEHHREPCPRPVQSAIARASAPSANDSGRLRRQAILPTDITQTIGTPDTRTQTHCIWTLMPSGSPEGSKPRQPPTFSRMTPWRKILQNESAISLALVLLDLGLNQR